MDNPKDQLVAKLKDANNVLVTVSTNPSVDQLAAAIGLTLFLSKLKKHATTVFSGEIPHTLDFLKPDETIEDNTDSLRDFIIALDKSKADKIRYKVEDSLVKIFITPYRTSIGEQDLVFSQGDFNVDVVVGLGIHQREDIDQAIMAHGRILHDATVATVNIKQGSEIGTVNWVNPEASSLSELMVVLTDLLKANSLDGQMATAFLTGIVAETERFSNNKTSSATMQASAKLMAAGANQQLVATKLEGPQDSQPWDGANNDEGGGHVGGNSQPADSPPAGNDGSLRIDHVPDQKSPAAPQPGQQPLPPPPVEPPTDEQHVKPWKPTDDQTSPMDDLPLPPPPEPPKPIEQVAIDSNGTLKQEEPKIEHDERPFLGSSDTAKQSDVLFGMPATDDDQPEKHPGDEMQGKGLVDQPPQFGGQLSATADGVSDADEKSNLDLPPILSHNSGGAQTDTEQPEDEGEDDEPAKDELGEHIDPYTVFDPQPTPPAEPEPVGASPPPNLPQAAEPVTPSLPPPPMPPPLTPPPVPDLPPKPTETGHPFVDLGDKTLGDIEQKVDSTHLKAAAEPAPEEVPEPDHDYHKEAAEQVARAMSTKTLDDIEHKIDSPHLDQPLPETDEAKLPESFAKALDKTTLSGLEEKVDSPHLDEKPEPAAPVLPPPPSPIEKPSALQYEPIESEPEEHTEPETEEAPKAEEPTADTPSTAPLPPPVDDSTATDDATTNAGDEEESKEPPKDETPPLENLPDEAAARDAVLKAVSATDSIEPRVDLATSGRMDVAHEATSAVEPEPAPSEASPNIDIAPDGTFKSLPTAPPPIDGAGLAMPPDSTDETAAPTGEAEAPPMPPPMMPPPTQ